MPGVVTRPAKLPLFRRRVPKDLVSCFPTAEIVKSLGTGSAADIRRRASHARALTEMLFMEVRADPTLTPADVRALTDVYLADLERFDRETRVGGLSRSRTSHDARIRFHDRLAADTLARQIEVGSILDPDVVCRIARQVGIEIEVGSPLEAEINEFLSRAFVRFHAEKAEHLRRDTRVGDRGLFDRGLKAVGLRQRTLPDIDTSTRRFGMSDPPCSPQPEPLIDTPATSVAAPIPSADDIARTLTTAIETLNDRLTNWTPGGGSSGSTTEATVDTGIKASASVEALWKKFIAFKIDSSKQWKPSRRAELNSTIALWQWLGEPTTVDGYGLRDAARFRDTYMSLRAGSA